MPLTALKIETFGKLIASLPDEPNANDGLTAQQVKEWFDASPEELRVAFNALIDTLAVTGASQIGATVEGITGGNVQAVLESMKILVESSVYGNVKTTTDQSIEGVKDFASSPIVPTPETPFQASPKGYVDEAIAQAVMQTVLGEIPDNSIGEIKMAATMKKQIGGVAEYDTVASHLTVSLPHIFSDGGTTYRYGFSVVEGVLTFNYEEAI
jgi:hypothetical protein